MAITAAFCCAFAAIAAINVNTRLKLIPPKAGYCNKLKIITYRFPIKILNNNRLTKTINSITTVL